MTLTRLENLIWFLFYATICISMKEFIRIFALLGVLIGIVMSILAFASDESLHKEEYTYESELVDSNLDGLKIVQLSDFHNHSLDYKNGNIIDMVKNENPDVVVLTGDLIDQYTKQKHLDNIKKLLDELKEIPVFYIDGNHEEYAGLKDEFFALISSYENIKYLKDEFVKFNYHGSSINLTGLIDPRNHFHKEEKEEVVIEYQEPIVKELSDSLDDDLSILLSHRPQLMDMYSKYKFDLVISGHTHGGQIKLSKPKKYQSGEWKVNDKTLIVSNGIGSNAKLPVRLNCPMQLVTITLKSK